MKLFTKLIPIILVLAALLSLAGCGAGAPGNDGANGLSAYEIAVKYGFEGSEAEWIESLQGKDAPSNVPTIGDNGNWFINGKDTGYRAKGNEIINNVLKDPTLEGKKIVCIGDEIFGETAENTSIGYFVSSLTGAEVTTVSLPGVTMAKNSDEMLDAFSMYQLADAIATRTYVKQKNASSSLDKSIKDALAVLESIDFKQVDKLIISFGLNDYLEGVNIGSGGSRDVSTYRGALAYALERICTAYSDTQVYVSTPLYCIFEDGVDSDSKKNARSKTLADYAEAALVTARGFKIPAIDNYNNLGINKINAAHYYSDETPLIPNRNGRELAARHIAKALF